MQKDNSQFFRRVQAALTAKGWNQSKLARAIGGTPAMMTRYSQGVMPRLETIQKIADALDTSVNRLISPDESLSDQADNEEVNPTTKHETFTLQETPMPYGHSHLSDGHKDVFIDQTMLEIRSRLEQLARASPDHRDTIRKHIVARVDEFAELCTLRTEDNPPGQKH